LREVVFLTEVGLLRGSFDGKTAKWLTTEALHTIALIYYPRIEWRQWVAMHLYLNRNFLF
jgi:hypothetical protein